MKQNAVLSIINNKKSDEKHIFLASDDQSIVYCDRLRRSWVLIPSDHEDTPPRLVQQNGLR